MAINWLTGITTTLAVLPQLLPTVLAVVNTLEAEGVAQAGIEKRSTALALINAGLDTAGAFGEPAQVSDAQRTGILTLAGLTIDTIVGFNNSVGTFRRSVEA